MPEAIHEVRPVLRDPGSAALSRRDEYDAYQNTIEQAVLGETMGFHSVWTLEHQLLTFDYLREANACIVGDPDEVVERCRAYEATGCDLLLCLMNPLKIPHEKVMQTIELMGKYVIPEFEKT